MNDRPQFLPQPPQFASSAWVFTQTPPQFVWPEGQQTPELQTWPAAHWWPQAPQLFASSRGDAQTPLQQAVCKKLQLLPQPPQFDLSVWMFTQTPLHCVIPAGQAQ